MVMEDDNFVLYGPEAEIPIPDGLLGHFLYHTLLNVKVKHECMIDAFTGETRSFKSILEDTCILAQALQKYGLQPNTVVAISSENNIRYFDAVIASFYVGATVAPINHVYTEHEIKHFLTLYRPKILFCSQSTVQRYVHLQKQYDFIEKIIIIYGDEVYGVENIKTFVQKQLGSQFISPQMFKPYNLEDQVDHATLILSSSGTTGLPKGVTLTDQNLLVRVAQSRHSAFTAGPVDGHTTFGLMPFFHGFGFNLGINTIANMECLIVMRQFDEDVFLRSIQDYKISVVVVAPALAVFLAKSPKLDNYDLSSVKEVVTGSAPMSKQTEATLLKRLNVNSVRQAYGLTESTLAVTIMRRKDKVKPGSSGSVIAYMALKIRDPDTGKSLGPNQVGEVCVRGPMIMKGYHRNPKATRETFTSDGWLKSGDLGYYDEDKYVFIVDRLKELIKYKGFQVAPAELEAILLDYPKVLDVGVIGVPDELAGELPTAFIVKKPGTDLTEEELQTFINKKVSPQKRLRGGIFFIDAIPRNATGKILRRVLKEKVPQRSVHRKSKL